MEKKFNNTKLNYISNSLKESANRMYHQGDLNDLGNEIGKIVASAFEDLSGDEIYDFIKGFEHGVSLPTT